jgi:hypothetical protein
VDLTRQKRPRKSGSVKSNTLSTTSNHSHQAPALFPFPIELPKIFSSEPRTR